jgi:hypothetical protein
MEKEGQVLDAAKQLESERMAPSELSSELAIALDERLDARDTTMPAVDWSGVTGAWIRHPPRSE